MEEFDVIKNALVPVLDLFEEAEYHNTGSYYISGGFARVDYDDYDEDYVYFTLKWGVQNDTQDTVNTEHYQLAIEDLLNPDLSVREKVRLIES